MNRLGGRYLRIEPEVDDRINADRHLGKHGGDGQDVEGDDGLWLVASRLCYRGAGIRKPTDQIGEHLKFIDFIFALVTHLLHHGGHQDGQLPVPCRLTLLDPGGLCHPALLRTLSVIVGKWWLTFNRMVLIILR